MITELPMPHACWRCQSRDIKATPYEPLEAYQGTSLWYSVHCLGCGTSTPMRQSHEAAVFDWNAVCAEVERNRDKRRKKK